MVYLVAAILSVVVVAALVWMMKRRKAAKPTGQATYSGPIRFTDPSGRNIKIVRKDDGSFEILDE